MATQRRTGIPTLITVARTMCKYIVKFTPLIRAFTDNNAAVMAALEAANAACGVLEAELQVWVEEGV